MTEIVDIRLDRLIEHPPARVWAALTQPEIQALWWVPGDVQPILGHRFSLQLGPWGRQNCEVLAVEPERRFSYLFAIDALDTPITWTLTPKEEGTHLHLEQIGFNLSTVWARTAYNAMNWGWPKVLEQMPQVLSHLERHRLQT